MSGFFSTLIDSGPRPALQATMAFQEERLKTIAENVANIHTPGYRAKHVDGTAFQGALRKALAAHDPRSGRPLEIRAGDAIRTDEMGRLQVVPQEEPVENVLFHDGTNLSVERQMADLAQTGLMHDLTSQLLRQSFEELRTAIRGTVR